MVVIALDPATESVIAPRPPFDPARWVRPATIVLAVYWLAMFVGTHVPRIPVSMEGGGTDKWLHFGAYAGLGFLLSTTLFLRGTPASTGRRALVVIFVGLLYGVADEWLQGFVGRDPDVLDWCADALGTACGTAVFHVFASRWLKP